MNTDPVLGSMCTGYGGLDLGVLAAFNGGRLAWCADPDPHVTQILSARFPGVPNLGDIRSVSWAAVEPIDVLTAGFPCQDISAAGRRAGIENGARSGLWSDIVAAVRVLRPALLVVENVAALRWKQGGLHRVLGDLAAAGYDTLWRSLRASDVGAAHRRERVFLLAWPQHAAHPDRTRRLVQRHQRTEAARWSHVARPDPAAADTDGLRREELHPSNATGRGVAAGRSAPAADASGVGHRDRRPSSGRRIPAAAVAAGAPAGRPERLAPDAAGDGRHEGLPGPARLEGRPHAALSRHAPDRPAGRRRRVTGATRPASSTVDWSVYSAAIRRWEQLFGRAAPHPTEIGQHGGPVLAPTFVEWLQGLPPGWITDLPLPRTAQLRALGNGVVPQQAARAVTLLLNDLAPLLDAGQGHGAAAA